jgi:SAM-dependent methyltransferase
MDMSEAPNFFTDGKAYERLMGRWSRLAGELFLDWIDAPKNLKWIDVGCGNGAFTEVLIARCAPLEVSGIDPSDGQLSYARTRPGTKMAQFKQADAQILPFADYSFDAASMALVITFLPDPVKAAREMARVVRPGGIVATYMWDFPGGGFPLAPLAVAMKSLGLASPAPPNVDASRRENMQAIWEQAGLQSVETQAIRIAVAYSSFDDFWDSNSVPGSVSGKAVSDLSPADRERLKARLRELLPIAADGRIAYEAFANAVKGRSPD